MILNFLVIKMTTLSKKDLGEIFRTKPSYHPKTNEPIKIGGKEYKQLEEKYGEPNKIKSPKSRTNISVNKGEYKKLIKAGYTDDQLLYGTNNIINKVSVKDNIPNYNFIGVKDVDLKILHLLKSKELYHVCQSNKYIYNLCQDDKMLKKRVKAIFKFIQFPMIGETYDFVNRPDINIKKVIKFNPDKYHLLFQMNPVYCHVDGIVIHLTDYKEQYFTEKIVIDEPVKLTLMDIIKLILDEFNKPELNEQFMKQYKKGALLMGIRYYKDGYYLMLDRYL